MDIPAVVTPAPLKQPSEVFRFLELPPELQLKVYEHYFGNWTLWVGRVKGSRTPNTNKVMGPVSLNLLAVSKKIYQDAKPMLQKCFSGQVTVGGSVSGRRPGLDLKSFAYKLDWLNDAIKTLRYNGHNRFISHDHLYYFRNLQTLYMTTVLQPIDLFLSDKEAVLDGALDSTVNESKGKLCHDISPGNRAHALTDLTVYTKVYVWLRDNVKKNRYGTVVIDTEKTKEGIRVVKREYFSNRKRCIFGKDD